MWNKNDIKKFHIIGENDKGIINNIKNKNNYNKELQIKKSNKANFEQRDTFCD